MILVPLEVLTDAVTWQGEVYAPSPDGVGELPADLVAHLAAIEAQEPAPEKQRIIPIRPGVFINDVLWNGIIYASTQGVEADPPADLVEWAQMTMPNLLHPAPAQADPQTVGPDGSMLEIDSPDLVAQFTVIVPEPIPSGVVNDSGHAVFGDQPQVLEDIDAPLVAV